MRSSFPIFIGDADTERVNVLKRLLEREFGLAVIHHVTWDYLIASVQNKNDDPQYDSSSPLFVFVADNLSPTMTFIKNVLPPDQLGAQLMMVRPDFRLTILTRKISDDSVKQRQIGILIVPNGKISLRMQQKLLGDLEVIFRPFYNRIVVPALVLATPTDEILKRQLQTLSDTCNLKDSLVLVKRLTSKFFPKVTDGTISRLGQGKSGAKVFHLSLNDGKKQVGEFVIKLMRQSAQWKLLAEVKGHYAACNSTLAGIEGVRAYIPRLWEKTIDESPIQCYEGWAGTCVDFLGGKRIGATIDLERILTGSLADVTLASSELKGDRGNPPDPVIELSRWREWIFGKLFLDWMWKKWFGEGINTTLKQHTLWLTTPPLIWTAAVYQPYCLWSGTKDGIIEFLESREIIWGKTLFDRELDNCAILIRDFLERSGDRTGIPFLDREHAISTGAVHGDLNANNVLIWPSNPDQPFLIDFPAFQLEGHVLQDFASLEKTLKFILMDRQNNGREDDPPALDHTHSQVPLWLEMENVLLGDQWDKEKTVWSAEGMNHNVALTFRLVQKVRQQAWQLQKLGSSGKKATPNFIPEYFAALLYHTLRTIGHEDLSVFKRLYAVYSAAKIIERLKKVK